MTSKRDHSQLCRKFTSSNAKYSILIFVFLISSFLLHAQHGNYSSWVTTYYVLSYDFGFIPRAFVGSAIALFTDYLSDKAFRIIAATVTLLMLAVISALLGKAIEKSNPDLKHTVMIFTLLFLTAPLCLTNMLYRHFGRLDTFLVLFTLIGLVCLKKPFIRWAIPALCFAALATHPGYTVTYMPALVIPLMYEVYRSKFSRKSIMLFSSSCTILVVFFIYFQFLAPKVVFVSPEAFAESLSTRTDMKIATPMLYLEYFSSQVNTFHDFYLPMMKSFAFPTIIVLMALTFPLILVFGAVWINSIRNTCNISLKSIFVLCGLAPLVFIPAALLGQDWERWWAAAISCQFIFIFYFVFSKEKPLIDSLKKVKIFFDKHSFILICILIYSSSFILSNINSFILIIFDKTIFLDYFDKVLVSSENPFL